MRIGDATQLLRAFIKARKPVLLTGAPGIGKTDVAELAATLEAHDLIVSHPVVSDPTDAKGLPWIAPDGQSATFLPFGELHRAINADMPTVWLIDDIGQASPATQASFMQLLLARRINGHMLPEHVTFVAATNRRTDRAGVSGILEPVKSRFATIVEVETHIDDWSNWAMGKSIAPELIAFLRFRPDLLHQFTATQDLVNQPSPRTWSHVASIITFKLSPNVEFEALKGAVGEGPASEFLAFLRIYRSMPNLDAIILDPMKAVIPDDMSTLWAVSTGLAAKVNDTNFARIVQYAERLQQGKHGEFAALLIRDCVRRSPKLCNTTTFIKLTSSDSAFGRLIMGN